MKPQIIAARPYGMNREWINVIVGLPSTTFFAHEQYVSKNLKDPFDEWDVLSTGDVDKIIDDNLFTRRKVLCTF